MDSNLPFVSIIIPAKNEEDYILDCLESFASQSYPKGRCEIIVVDDQSEDKTATKVTSYISQHEEKSISLIENQAVGVGEAYRTGLKYAQGEIILRATAHIIAPSALVLKLVTSLTELDESYVGTTCNLTVYSNDSALSQVIVAIITSIGGYGTSHYSSSKTGETNEAKAIMAIRASIFPRIGGYPLGDDSELNALIKRAGFKFWLIGDLYAYYRYKYSTLPKHSQRMFRYGCARAHDFKNYRESRNFAYIIPSLILLYLTLTPLACWFSYQLGLILIIVDILAMVAISGYFLYKLRRVKFIFLSPIVVLLTYLPYGLGFIAGLVNVYEA